MIKSIFFKSVMQWRFALAILVMLIFANDRVQVLIMDINAVGLESVHWLEPAASMFTQTLSGFATIAILIWLCDAPFFNQNEMMVVHRTGRWNWILGRIAYALMGTGAVLAVQSIFITLRALPYLGGGELSEIFYYAAAVMPQPLPPVWAAGMGFLLNWMSTSIFVLLMFAINMRYSQGIGLVVAVMTWGMDVLFDWNFGYEFAFLSPTTMKSVLNLSGKYLADDVLPSMTEAFLIMGGAIALLIAIILLLTPGYPFPFVKSRQGRTTD